MRGADLGPVKVDHVQPDAFFGQGGGIEQKVAEIAVAVVEAAPVHAGAGHGEGADDAVPEFVRRRVLLPVAAEILQGDHADQVLGHEEGLHAGGIDAADAERAGGHGGDAELGEERDGEIFVGGAYDGELELQKILPNLAPADGPVKLDEVGFAVHAEPHGPAVLHVAEDLALHGERVTEGVLAPGFLKGVGEIELFHAETPVSAAGGGT